MVSLIEPTARADSARLDRLTKALEWPTLLLDDGAATPRTHAIATAANWIIWIAFARKARRPAAIRSGLGGMSALARALRGDLGFDEDDA